MKKRYLRKHPELFQAEKRVNKEKRYFEGWYFKNQIKEYGISFIPGIQIEEHKKKAFIQVITKEKSYYIEFDFNEFEYSKEVFLIKIGKNTFSDKAIHIDIEDKEQNITIKGILHYTNHKKTTKTMYSPNIMGPFSYCTFMECNHAIISMKHSILGKITVNNKSISFNGGTGYMEKDWGESFPKTYLWAQANEFNNKNASFMCSIADIPFKHLEFKGLICVVLLGEKEYRFSTYNLSRIKKVQIAKERIEITLTKGNKELKVQCNHVEGFELKAPNKGEMSRIIKETINADIKIELRIKNQLIFSDSSKNSGLEIVNKRRDLNYEFILD